MSGLMYIFEGKNISFTQLLNLNEETVNILDETYNSILNNEAKLLLDRLEFKWYVALNQISPLTEGYADSIYDMNIVHKSFEKYKNNLCLTTKEDLDKVFLISTLVDILVESALEFEDLDTLWEGFYQIGSRLRKYQLLNSNVE